MCVLPQCGGRLPFICGDGSGGAFVAWLAFRDVDEDIYVRRVLANGSLAPGWSDLGTPATTAPGDQYLSGLIPDGQGGVYALWYEWPSYDIYVQRVLGNGQIAPGWPANGQPVCVKPGYQLNPQMIADGVGGVFVVWQDGEFVVPGDIYAQRLNGDGTVAAGWPESGLAVCTDPADQLLPYLASDEAGGFIVAWADLGTGEALIFATRVTGTGGFAPGWPVNGKAIIAGETGQGIRSVVADGTGGAYVRWDRVYGPFVYEDDVYVIRILGDGSVAPGWPAGGYPVSTRSFSQYSTGMVADGAGGVVLAWYDNLEQPAVAFAQRLTSAGAPALGWPASGVRVSDINDWHFAPRLAPNGSGGAYVAVEIGAGLGYMQHLLPDGSRAPGWPASGIALVKDLTGFPSQRELAITSDGSGGAIVAWNDARAGRQDQIYAQRFYGDGPTPVLVSLVSADAQADRVTLLWHRADGVLAEAVVHRRREPELWAAIGVARFDGSGRATYEDREVAAGARYAYRLGWTESGVEHFTAETWVEVPAALAFALEGARPNPAMGPLTVAFTLARPEPATLELMDVAGRQLMAREVGSLGPGRHTLRLGECACTPPGVYWLRLTQATRSLTKRAIVVR